MKQLRELTTSSEVAAVSIEIAPLCSYELPNLLSSVSDSIQLAFLMSYLNGYDSNAGTWEIIGSIHHCQKCLSGASQIIKIKILNSRENFKIGNWNMIHALNEISF